MIRPHMFSGAVTRRARSRCPGRLGVAALVVFAIAQLTPAVATARTATAVRTGVIQWLERNQRSDGAWDTGYASQRPLATAEALLALAKASRGTHVTARRAVGCERASWRRSTFAGDAYARWCRQAKPRRPR
jgi:hypothetical protein